LAAPLTELECCHVMTRRARQGCQRVATVDIYRCRYCHGVTTVFLRRQLGEPKRGQNLAAQESCCEGFGTVAPAVNHQLAAVCIDCDDAGNLGSTSINISWATMLPTALIISAWRLPACLAWSCAREAVSCACHVTQRWMAQMCGRHWVWHPCSRWHLPVRSCGSIQAGCRGSVLVGLD
jgi:hypothetical protein